MTKLQFKWMRRMACVLTALTCMLLHIQPFFAAAQTDERLLYDNYIYYTISSAGEVIIQNARASIREAIIPDQIDGCPVTEIEGYAFKDCTYLTTVTLPDSLRRIGEFAFQNCTRLTELRIPDTVTEIGWGIVQGTPWLSQQQTDFVLAGDGILLAYCGSDARVTVPDGVRTIAGFAFSGCDAIVEITLPETLLAIDAFAFDQCTALQQIELPHELKTIGEYAFHWCTSLRSAILPDSVTRLGNHAFSYCKSLETVKLSASMTQIANMTFHGCTELYEVTIPEGITTIGSFAFQDCTSIETILLPETLTKIDSGVFDGCTSLTYISIPNAACQICDDAATLSTADIHGMLVSTANTYAEKYCRTFYALDYLRGDFDENGIITIQDSFLVLVEYALRSVGKPTELTKVQQYTADYDNDGEITLKDSYQILLHYAKVSAGIIP